jgi:glycosyltransferase involved in cell wall biosynthesis
MRILMMIASMAESGGAEMLVRNLSLAYARAGHTCHIVYISDAASVDANAAYERMFKAEMDAAGVGYTELGHHCRRRLPLGALRLRRTIARFRPDVFHVHLPYGLLFQALGFLRVPTVYTHHNIIFKFSPSLFRVFDCFVHRYIAICRACEQLLAPHISRPISLIYNGVPSAFAQGTVRSAPAANPSVLSVGNLTPQKNYLALVELAKMLVCRFDEVGTSIRFLIAGEGSERPRIAAAIAAAGLPDKIELLGARSDVARLMAEADLILNMSDFEGLPISLIEAASSGLPAVATRVGGTPEIIDDGVNGRLVGQGDVVGAAAAVENLLTDSEQYSRFSAAAVERSTRFGLDGCVEAHLRLYAEVAQV